MNLTFLNVKQKVRQFGISTLIIGGVLYLHQVSLYSIFIIVGAILLAFFYFLASFNQQKKTYDWELVYPSLALGSADHVKYEEFENGPAVFIYRSWRVLLSFSYLSLVVKFFIWMSPEYKLNTLLFASNVILSISLCALSGIYLVSIFSPIKQKPNWALVFPELKVHE